MKKKFTPLKITSIILFLCLILELSIYQKISFLQTTNITFSAASLFLIISLLWSVFYSGAFDFFHYSMKKVTTKIHREDLSEQTDIIPLSKSVGQGYKLPLKVGILLMLISMLSLIFHYFT
ncbi:protein of unknown function [Carnobacterium iners]|uniref:DUF3899 domain-containing protein n=1 Tax=Carnobacterium iners TaxID=1073423 RepID=A0A1X7NPS1_9LACT|nr:DUF3899 domain-containing protein [Carnobacterium iners]SEK28256.1 protein of unknown function [Carnobacterium iners]SMH39964.1 protein of unknown function [Carnobacterium iners]